MSFCTNCGAELSDGVKFCNECGTPVNETENNEKSIGAIFRRNKIAPITGFRIGGGVLMLVIGIILISIGESYRTFVGGLMFAIIGAVLMVGPRWVLEEIKKIESKDNKITTQTNNSSKRIVGKDSDEFYDENYEDMVEFLKARGFRNVVVKSVKKGFFDTDEGIESISIAGDIEFNEDDEFDIDSKIIIRYYSKNI